MSLSLIINRNLKSQGLLLNMILNRLVHRNHPGHKTRVPAMPVNLDLPDEKFQDNIPIYPPIKPKYPPGSWPNEYDAKLAWRYFEEGEKFHSLRTIQERLSVLAYLNVQQVYDDLKFQRTRYFPIFQIKSAPRAAKSLPFVQFITKTNLNLVEKLPDNENSKLKNNANHLYENDKALYEKLKKRAQDCIMNNLILKELDFEEAISTPEHPDKYKPEEIENEKFLQRKHKLSNQLIKDLMDSLTSILASKKENYSHLHNAQYGYDVDVKGYWKKCGFKDQRPRGAVIPDEDVIRFQFEDVATYQLKTERPLMPLYDFNHKSVIESSVPEYAYNPANFRIFADHILPMQIPGHWYGDKREFNYLTVYNTTKVIDSMRDKFVDNEFDLEAIKNLAILTGHAELTSQAYYLGFSMWKNLTYPMFGQFMFTNGQDYSFANYQLNNLELWHNGSNRNNLCHMTVPQRLFELTQDGKQIKSFNDDLFKQLLKTLSTNPIDKETNLDKNYSNLDYKIGGTRLRPYLTVHEFDKQLTQRHQLFAISLYELIKFDKPLNYLNFRAQTKPISFRPKYPELYDKYTYQFRDIVLKYYPRDYYGISLTERVNRKFPKQVEEFWDQGDKVYEWANVPPLKTNNIPRKIDLSLF